MSDPEAPQRPAIPPPDLLGGICSVTLRSLPRSRVVELTAEAGLVAVEWGGDVHVPHGDLAAADDARALSRQAGLVVVSYGSYLFLDSSVSGRRGAETLGAVLDTTEALGAPGLRVWCPFGPGPDAAADERAEVARAAESVAAAAAERGLSVTLEFHGNTLTATAESAAALLDQVGADNLFTAWQAPYWDPQSAEAEIDSIEALAPRLAHVHVYEWQADHTRLPLARGSERWPARLAAAARSGDAAVAAGVPRSALLEFVPGDEPGSLAEEAATLLSWSTPS